MREMIEAALRRQRVWAVGALIVGLFAGLAAVRIRDVGGPFVLLTALPLVAVLWAAVRQLSRRPSDSGLRIDEQERAFFAPPRREVGFLPVLAGFLPYQGVTTWAGSDGDAWLRALAAFFALASVAFVTLGLRDAPSVELTPEGIVHRRHEKRWSVPWEALDPTGQVGSPGKLRAVSLPIHRPELVRASGWGRGRSLVAVGDVDVVPEQLANTIRYYLAHPEHRAAIGTPEEYARLRRALGGAP